MEQMLLLYESEKAASALAQSVIHALPMRTVGFRLLPYAIAGQPRGELIHCLASDDPVQNDVPCTLRLSREKIVSIDAVWAELAAPAEPEKPNAQALSESSGNLLRAARAMAKAINEELDAEDSAAEYMALDLKTKLEWIANVLEIAEENEGLGA